MTRATFKFGRIPRNIWALIVHEKLIRGGQSLTAPDIYQKVITDIFSWNNVPLPYPPLLYL